MQSLKSKIKTKLIENRLVVDRGVGWGVGEMSKGSQKVQTFQV